MTQLPFPSQPGPPLAYSPQPPHDPHRRNSVSSIASTGYSGPGYPTEPNNYRPSPPMPSSSALPSYVPLNTNQSQAYQDPIPSMYSNTPQPYPQPVPPPRRAATLPSTPLPPFQPAAAVPTPVASAADPLAAHHRSLVAYYWHYAQQGYSAPLTASPGTDESVMQDKARNEAVDWARQCGIEVREVETQPRPRASMIEPSARTRTASRPLPVAPSVPSPTPDSNVTATPPIPSSSRPAPTVGISGGRPLPPAPLPQQHRSVSLANPIHPSSPNPTPPYRSVSEAQPRPQPFPPPISPSPLLRTASPASERKRPLPAPPLVHSSSIESAQLESQFDSVAISPPIPPPFPGPTQPIPPAIPTISFGDQPPVVVVPPPRSPSPHPTPPSIPTFAFNDDSPPNSSSSPAVPSFSFSTDGDEPNPSVPSVSAPTDRRAPPIHPRYDPSHPSHALYHPTSVASPLSNSSASPSSLPTSTSSTTIEAGTISCTSCNLPIFGRVLLALSRTWHPGCFVCAEKGCREKLEVMEFEGTPEDWDEGEGSEEFEGEGGERESLRGKAWCMVHFEERFALQCYHCHTPISSADYLPINDPSLPPSSSSSSQHQTSTRYYHPLHFFCAGCGDPFLDPVAYERSGEAIAMPYYVREQHPYCTRCDLRIWREKCPGCGKGVREEDGYVEIGNGGGGGEEDEGEEKKKKWHQGCFKCSMCSKPLSGIYLLRPEPSTTSTDAPTDKPYCGECFDIVAKEEAVAAVG